MTVLYTLGGFIAFYICFYPYQRLLNDGADGRNATDSEVCLLSGNSTIFDANFGPNLVSLKELVKCDDATSTVKRRRKQRWRPVSKFSLMTTVLLLLAGDVSTNPGPRRPQHPCGMCNYAVAKNTRAIQCDECDMWVHFKCIEGMTVKIYKELSTNDENWYCAKCKPHNEKDNENSFIIYNFSDSFFNTDDVAAQEPDVNFSTTDDTAAQQPSTDGQRSSSDIFEHFVTLRKSNPGNFILAYININSLSNKFDELRNVLDSHLVDCLFVAETKLNNSHSDSLFQVPNYNTYRKDNIHDNGGGLICFLRSDFPSHEEKIESHPCENLTIIAHIDNSKWAFIGAYRKPSLPEKTITEKLDTVIEKCSNLTENIVIAGDLNCNMAKNGPNSVKTLCEDHNLQNLIKEPTCFKADPPTLLDVILINEAKHAKKSVVIPCPLSDFHHFVCTVLEIKRTKVSSAKVTYRSYKNFDIGHFRYDLETAPFHVSECLDTDDQCYFITKLYTDILEEHAPKKTKTIKIKQCPYMNKEWRSAIHRKHQLYNKYWKEKTQRNWHNYRKQRNLCQKLRRTSLKNYMNEKCTQAKSRPKDFWKMVQPYLSNKSKTTNCIQLIEDGKFVTKPEEVAEVFNVNFTTIADSIGDESNMDDISNHPSCKTIESRTKNIDEFHFKPTNVKDVKRCIDKLNVNKSTGYDGIPAKVWKASSDIMSPIICNTVNKMFETNDFPDSQKRAEVTPIFKAKSRLEWSNYRPVSVLTSLSKVFEYSIAVQMQPHLQCIFSKFLSAYRANHGCNSVLEYTTEIWKKALDEKLYVGVLMSDLSKAFDCLPHSIMLEKFKRYKFSENAVTLLQSYLSDRYQRVKVKQSVSSWKKLKKGVPQGSIIGPQCFNIYINDLLYVLEENEVVPCNYADDNSLSVTGKNKDEVIQKMQEIINVLRIWFSQNMMKLNVEKFQFMLLYPSQTEGNFESTIEFENVSIKNQKEVKLLGIQIDCELSFKSHILYICKKANAKLQILKRLSKYLNEECKLSVLRCFILSQFIYCSILFHFSTQYCKNRMEKILYKGLRYVFNDYESSYDVLLKKAEMDSIGLLREKTILCTMYKCKSDQGPLYLRELFMLSKRPSRDGQRFVIPNARTTHYGLHSLRFLGPKLWNALSREVKELDSLSKFKNSLKNYNGNACKCAICKT